MTGFYEVRRHRGRSGRSVFEWRVYHRFGIDGRQRTQLGKYRTKEAAERRAAQLRENAARVAAKWAEFEARKNRLNGKNTG